MAEEVFGDIEDFDPPAATSNPEKPKQEEERFAVPVTELKEQYPELPEILIDGICRRQEVMNVIAAPKVGKSFFAAQMGLCVQNGIDFLGFEVPGSRQSRLHRQRSPPRGDCGPGGRYHGTYGANARGLLRRSER
jgi:hypothetical protein